MDNSFTKNKLPFFVQYCWDKKKAESPGIDLKAVAIVFNAWYTTDTRSPEEMLKDDPNWQPSTDPKRQEILFFNICYRNEVIGCGLPFKRKGRNIEFLPAMILKESYDFAVGWVGELFPSRL